MSTERKYIMARKKKDDTKEVKKVAKKSTKAVDKNNGISQINRFNILFVDLHSLATHDSL